MCEMYKMDSNESEVTCYVYARCMHVKRNGIQKYMLLY